MRVIWNSCTENNGKYPEIYLEISRSPPLTAVAALQSTVYNATKNEFLTKFSKSALKLTQNFQETISNGVPF